MTRWLRGRLRRRRSVLPIVNFLTNGGSGAKATAQLISPATTLAASAGLSRFSLPMVYAADVPPGVFLMPSTGADLLFTFDLSACFTASKSGVLDHKLMSSTCGFRGANLPSGLRPPG